MNPAVTVALATLGKVQWKKVLSMSYTATDHVVTSCL